ncbi:MAG: CusA/CzcA family heavy metal efflux RND transporter [Deltaproteobacteria bacterium]|jgi:Cu(I)/Ag(I) efflux system membrane protein CusA/SilA|nr:CusA/CzcA family heavy metal efflux RND transporter [Deltaproteobacteria bacterium]MCL5880210.1 CusA/CzcA family heavy metal efflux RND transporter [Deltaproteobacteria bacterium]MDA8304303.1 CusA/CzcA family heavy metal efflux RND transporter [Deltaproteobacteria bacterium]
MINKIIDYCINNQFLVFVFMLFLGLGGVYAMYNIRLTALPDIAPQEVIIKTNWSGQPPNIVQLHVTYPIETALISAPKVREVRGSSMYGTSFVTVVFKRGTSLGWARAQVLTYLSQAKKLLPPAVTPVLSPYANGVDWVYQYAIIDKSHNQSLADLYSFQQYFLRYNLETVPGVAQVATYGGFYKEYQITLNPKALQYYNISLSRIINDIRASNADMGARVIDSSSGVSHLIYVKGYLRNLEQIRNIVVGTSSNHVPVLVKNVGTVEVVPAATRSISDLNGNGQVIGGVVIKQQGSNTLNVINAVKKRLKSLKSSLPKGAEIITTYNQNTLIHRSISTLKSTILMIVLIVIFVILLFLFHLRSSLVIVIMIPFAIMGSFLLMYMLHISANIMSLSGIALAIGAMTDSAIVMIENSHSHLEILENHPEICPYGNMEDKDEARKLCIVDSAKEMGKPLFYSLIIIAVGFLPIFFLSGEVGALFKPLAYTKTFSMIFAAVLSVIFVPILMIYLIKGKITPLEKNPVNRFLVFIYSPLLKFVMKYKAIFLILLFGILGSGYYAYSQLGSQFMPQLNEGTLLYMPSSVPGLSYTDAAQLLQVEDRIIKKFPEVKIVTGKAGRADTAFDPASLAMTETTIVLKRRKYWPAGMTVSKLIDKMNKALKIPGLENVWTMPIKNRIEMTSAGLRTPIGIKIYGSDIKEVQKLAEKTAAAVSMVKGTLSAYAERVYNRPYIVIKPKPRAMGFYGLTLKSINEAVATSVGGKTISTIYDGLARYPLSVRYPYLYRNNLKSLRNVLVKTGNGFVPLKELASIKYELGPAFVSSQGGMLDDTVDITLNTPNMVLWAKNAKNMIKKYVKFPNGYTYVISGEYKSLKRANNKLMLIVPLTIFIIFLLIYFNFKSIPLSTLALLSIPFALVGAFWYLYLMHITLSIAVWVGIIAVMGVSTEIGVVMISILELTFHNYYKERDREAGDSKEFKFTESSEIEQVVIKGATIRLRPIVMTAMSIIMGLLPAMFAYGTGARMTKFITSPMIGGMISATLLNLFLLPVFYFIWKKRTFTF